MSKDDRLGHVTIEPLAPCVAGSYASWTITLTVGSVGIDEGGTIKVAQRFAADTEPSQFDRPKDPAYTTVWTNGQAKLRPHYEKKGHDRPWMQCIVIDVYDGSLAPGDVVKVVLGDRSQGSPGIRAQTFQESKHDLRVFVDPTNACVARPVANQSTFPIVPDKCVELVAIVASQTLVNEPTEVFVKGQDKWGNPTAAPADLHITPPANAKIVDGKLVFNSPGTGVVTARAENLSCQSNPITAYAASPKYKKYWGDLHAQSDATVGTGSEEEYFAFGRDVARLDFCSHQANDFQVTDANWKKLNDVVRQYHRDGSYVVFPGWEWSGNSTVGGDRNVWFLEEDQPMWRSSHWQISEPETAKTPADNVGELFKRVRAHRPDITLLGAHVGGRYADTRLYFDQELGPLVELVSCWGVFEWMLWDAFDMGHIAGVMCNSDGHKGRPGAEGPGAGQFGIPNGLTCVLAETKTRLAIWDALKNRRCYGTTGARIDLDFSIDGHLMGSVITGGSKASASARATAPIEKLELFAGKQVIHTQRPREFDDLSKSKRIRIAWRGSRIRGRGRRVNWDGTITFTSAKILSAESHFDTPVDRITGKTDSSVTFISQTTGDTDWIDFTLDHASDGKVIFDSKAGNAEVDLAKLTSEQTTSFGGLGIEVTVQRYPENPQQMEMSIEHMIEAEAGKITPFFVKLTQTDGQMAWASPIYVDRRSEIGGGRDLQDEVQKYKRKYGF